MSPTSGHVREIAFGRSLSLALFLACACLTFSPSSFGQDFGYEGPSYAGSSSTPSASKPESKLWNNDSFWWGILWSTTYSQFRIHRLDPATQTWIDTGTGLVSSRKNSRADVLWDGTKLYVASHEYGTTPTAGKPTRLYRFSYIAAFDRYQLDAGFPVNINNYKLETVVIDKDSTGTIWATWVQNNVVYINHSVGSDTLWGTPTALPTTTIVSSDDISSLIHFGGDRVGVLWSDQVSGVFWFSFHLDADPDLDWSVPEMIVPGTSGADDHLNLKTDSAGHVFAAVKNIGNEVLLLVRNPAGKNWSKFLAGAKADKLTRPIVAVNEELGEIYFIATNPETGGTIYLKTSSLSSIAFGAGQGTPLIRDADVLRMNNATSTKQNLNSATGLVVLATNQTTERYWHSVTPLAPPGPPVASFVANPTQGSAPLMVQFTDTSLGVPTSWTWDFGDGDSSSEQHPLHTYLTPGTYTVSLTVNNNSGFDMEVQTDLITVEVPPPTLTFTAVEDSHVKSTSPDNNYGTQTTLRARFTTLEEYRPYVKFDVSGLPGTIVAATLRLFVTDPSPDGGSVHLVDNGWAETTITWNNAPFITGDPLGSFGEVFAGTYVELDVSSVVTAEGTFSFALRSADGNSVFYSSREGSAPPELLVTWQ